MAITLGLVEAVDDTGVYVSMPGTRGVLRGPYAATQTVVAGQRVLLAATDGGEQVVVGVASDGNGEVNVKAFGAVGDNSADDSAAIQSAIDAASELGAAVFVPPGRYRCLTGLSVPAFTTVHGSVAEWGQGGTGITELIFPDTGSSIGVTLGAYARLEDLYLRGPYSGTSTGVRADTSPELSRLVVAGFSIGVRLQDAYYAGLSRINFSRCDTGLQLVGCYDVSMYGCTFTYDADSTYNAINAGTVRSLQIFGGSIEHYRTAIDIVSGGLHMFGVYFEAHQDGSEFVVGVECSSTSGVNLLMEGCTVYMDGTSRFVNASGATDHSLTAHGNIFFSGADAGVTGQAYYLSTDASAFSHLSGDNWAGVQDSDITYVGSALNAGPTTSAQIVAPRNANYPTEAPTTEYVARTQWIADGVDLRLQETTGSKIGTGSSQKLAFWGATPTTRPTVTGSRGGNAALQSLLTALANVGLITDSTT